MMQLATVRAGAPWICTVYFVADEQMNCYWLSYPTRRHSRELRDDKRAAVAIPVKYDNPPIIGMQFEGIAAAVKDPDEVRIVMERYVAKYGHGKDFHKKFEEGTNQHVLYRSTPTAGQLFDEVNFPGGQPVELAVTPA